MSLYHLPVPYVALSLLQAEAAVAAVAVADTVRDCPPTAGAERMSKAWGRGGCTSALVTPAPGTSAGGSTGPSAAASFFIRYVLWGHTSCGVLLGNGGPECLAPGGLWHVLRRTVAQSVKEWWL